MSTDSMKNIPLVDLKRQHAQVADEVAETFAAVLGSMQLFLGPNVKAFETEFAEYLGVERCLGVCDGTMALQLALRACGLKDGDEVITVSHTFFATAEAIILAGGTPVFVDVDPCTFTMDPAKIEAAITDRTKAILPVHLYGRMADMPTIMEIARSRRIRVIEDASQAHGARMDGKAAGTFGDAGCFSFYYSKNLGAYGEAGGVVTNDAELAGRVAILRDHGSAVRYHHDVVGLNGRLDELQAGVLRAKLRRLEGWNARRRNHSARYNELLLGLPVTVPEQCAADHVHHLYVIRCNDRDDLQKHLESRGVHTGIHYPIPCHKQPALKDRSTGSLPVTDQVVEEILSLPMFPELENEEIEYVVDSIAEYYAMSETNREVHAAS